MKNAVVALLLAGLSCFSAHSSLIKLSSLDEKFDYSSTCIGPASDLNDGIDTDNNLFSQKLKTIAQESEEFVSNSNTFIHRIRNVLSFLTQFESSQGRLLAIDLEAFLLVHERLNARLNRSLIEVSSPELGDPNERLIRLTAVRNDFIKLKTEYSYFEELLAKSFSLNQELQSAMDVSEMLTRQVQLKLAIEGLLEAIETYHYCHYNLLPDFLYFQQKIKVKQRYYNLTFSPLAIRLNGEQDLVSFVIDSVINQEKNLSGMGKRSLENFDHLNRSIKVKNLQEIEKNLLKLVKNLRRQDQLFNLNVILSKVFYHLELFSSNSLTLNAIKLHTWREKAKTVNENLRFLSSLFKDCLNCTDSKKRLLRDEIKNYREELKSLHVEYSDLYLKFLEQLKKFDKDVSAINEIIPMMIETLIKEIGQ